MENTVTTENATKQNNEEKMYRVTLYNDQKANGNTVWLLYLFLGWSYGSLGKFGTQILFYLTGGGLGIWAFIRLFTLSGSIKKYNHNVANRLGLTNEEKFQVGLTY